MLNDVLLGQFYSKAKFLFDRLRLIKKYLWFKVVLEAFSQAIVLLNHPFFYQIYSFLSADIGGFYQIKNGTSSVERINLRQE
ncbi:hypothetical protein [uncultured Arcticibacterium sp.]|uniref:hypothetical protein n=1 Tax=uncultured Arcticibacterium sp. TaxID=2173042 RepID=UPI0030F89264